MNSTLQKVSNYLSLFNKSVIRNYCSKTKDGISYYGFTYYPRHENFEDPPHTPSKLFLVKRVKRNVGCTAEEKQILAHFKFKRYGRDKFKDVVIVKNIPQVNALLWKIKHLVDIKPITWQGELPEDSLGTFIRDNGELVISPKLKVPLQVFETTENFANCKMRFSMSEHKKYLLNKWQHGEYDGE